MHVPVPLLTSTTPHPAQRERRSVTQGLSATINSALREVARRHALADFDVLRDLDGTPDKVRSGRKARCGAKSA